MESNKITCPVCKTNYDNEPEKCLKCEYPFNGTEKEKSIFIGQQIFKKETISEAKAHIKKARIILWVIGGLFLLMSGFLAYNGMPSASFLGGLILGGIFLGFGFLSYKFPFISILLPFIILFLFYVTMAIIDISTLLQGLIWKIIFMTGLGYALFSMIQAEKIKKESKFLEEHDYK